VLDAVKGPVDPGVFKKVTDECTSPAFAQNAKSGDTRLGRFRFDSSQQSRSRSVLPNLSQKTRKVGAPSVVVDSTEQKRGPPASHTHESPGRHPGLGKCQLVRRLSNSV
jgi:hypothetical protein